MNEGGSNASEHVATLKTILATVDGFLGDIKTVELQEDIQSKSYDLIRRAALVRQREALDAVVTLCETGHAAFAVCFLRPAYEELVWLEYLNKHAGVANAIIKHMTQIAVAQSVQAQADFSGSLAMRDMGFSAEFVAATKDARVENESSLIAIGKKLGWKRNSPQPTFKELAEAVGRASEYQFLYHATSRFVHFSPQELLRRIWGKPSKVTISSKHFSAYWTDFALHWAFAIYLESILACDDFLDGAISGEAHDEFIALLKKYIGKVPIITREELLWPGSNSTP